MKPFIKNVFYLLLPMIMLQGCIKEKPANCDFTLYINFEQINTCLPTGLYPSDLSRIDIFAFDENGFFVNQFTALDPATGADYRMAITLPKGTFTLIAWAGFDETQLNLNHFIKGVTKVNEAYIASFIAGDHSNMTSPYTLYYGIKNNFSVQENSAAPEIITLMQKTKPVHLNLGGKGLNPADDFQISISNNATYYRFDDPAMRLNPGDSRTITPLTADAPTSSFKAATNLLWPLNADNPPVLTIHNLTANTTSYSLPLADLLDRLPSSDLDCEPTINIAINYISDVQVEVKINGWTVLSFDTEI